MTEREGLQIAVRILGKMQRRYDKEGDAAKALWCVAYRKAAERVLGELP